MSLDEIGINDLLELYKKKHTLIQESNLTELINLKKIYPELFVEEKEKEVNQLIETTNFLTQMPHFKAMLHEEKKRKLISIDDKDWQRGRLTEILNQHKKISYVNIHNISRSLVKEAIVICLSICNEKAKNPCLIEIFPLLGQLISEILIMLPKEKREHRLKLAMFKMRGKEVEKSKLNEIETEISPYYLLRNKVRDSFAAILKDIILKFDQRKEFHNDLLFFCLIEVAEFIGLLIPSIGGCNEDETTSVINKVEKNILIYEAHDSTPRGKKHPNRGNLQ